MKFKNKGAEFYIPDNRQPNEAISRTTHMAIAAHQDDIEFMAQDGIIECFGKEDKWFYSVVVTNGAGSPRNGLYEEYTDEQMQAVRKLEQKKAAFIGEYGALALLDYPSGEVKDPKNTELVNELKDMISAARPKVIYTHNLADKHDTHLGVAAKVIRAIRELPAEVQPEKLYGCEVWRSLDWVNDEEKLVFDVSAHPNIASSLLGVFDSQICGGKRYDLATTGRRLANATYYASHGTDMASSLMYAMDLTPLLQKPSLDIRDYISGYIDRFKADVQNRLSKVL